MKILIIDDQAAILESLSMHFSEIGYKVLTSEYGQEGINIVRKDPPDIVILDMRLPDIDGMEVLKVIKSINNNIPIIMITAFHDMETTIEAMKNGAYDYVHKPIDIRKLDDTLKVVTRTIKIRNQMSPDTNSPKKFYKPFSIIGESAPIQKIFKLIGQTCNRNNTILIQGDSGTGKELIAKAIHYNGIRKDEPFICVNCGSLVETLLESELFGHEKGSFTHALYSKKGKFELAGKGTIFLDEVGELALSTQVKLLRFLQEREFERVGGERIIKSTARIIAATNRNLAQMVIDRSFREDLFFRLKVVTINVPPLRERKADIPLLIDFFMHKIADELNEGPKHLSNRALKEIMEYNWPGNIRELENVLMRAFVLSPEKVVVFESIQSAINETKDSFYNGNNAASEHEGKILSSLEDIEKNLIIKTLRNVDGSKGKACERLRMSRPTLRKKIKEYGIQKY